MSNIEHEIEVKIVLESSELTKVFDALSPSAVNGKIKEKHRPRAYFDTHKRNMKDINLALRVQYKEGVGYEQTLKYEVPSGESIADENGKLSRIEVKNVLGESKKKPDLSLIDLSLISDDKVKKSIKKLKDKKLEHVFSSSVKRKYFIVPVVEDGAEIGKVELAFDPGKVMHAVESDLFKEVSEIEVELKSGDVKAVDIMCDRILSMASGAEISSASKAQIGYELDDQARSREQASKEVADVIKEECKALPKKSRKMLPNI